MRRSRTPCAVDDVDALFAEQEEEEEDEFGDVAGGKGSDDEEDGPGDLVRSQPPPSAVNHPYRPDASLTERILRCLAAVAGLRRCLMRKRRSRRPRSSARLFLGACSRGGDRTTSGWATLTTLRSGTADMSASTAIPGLAHRRHLSPSAVRRAFPAVGAAAVGAHTAALGIFIAQASPRRRSARSRVRTRSQRCCWVRGPKPSRGRRRLNRLTPSRTAANGQVWMWGNGIARPAREERLTMPVVQLAAGAAHFAAVTGALRPPSAPASERSRAVRGSQTKGRATCSRGVQTRAPRAARLPPPTRARR